MRIKRFSAVGIFDRQDILFDFSISPFFIVGPNGTGKSTSLKILYFVLTGQWTRLKDLPFVAVEITFDSQLVRFEKLDFPKIIRLRNYMTRSSRRESRRARFPIPDKWIDAEPTLRNFVRSSSGSAVKLSRVAIDDLAEIYPAAALIINTVELETKANILYFPTYRRVERDLRDLLETDEIAFEDERSSIEPKIAERFASAGEVVGFGGQDIKSLLSETASRIESASRKAFNEHSVRYLETLVGNRKENMKAARSLVGSYNKTEKLLQRLASLSSDKINTQMISEGIVRLQKNLSNIKQGRLNQKDEILVLYISSFIQLLEKNEMLAAPLLEFATILNRYLKPFKSSFLRESDNEVIMQDLSGNELQIEQLSSGEKQIIAFFAFTLLRIGPKLEIVIIDEPELSLSVSWQKSLVSDLMTACSATYFVCATHSPFIFQESSIGSIKSLGEL